MIIDLIIVALSCLVAWVVSGIIYPTDAGRRPRPGIADTTPPTSAELSGEYLIPPHVLAAAAKLGKRVVAGESPPRDTSALWYSGPLLDDVEPAVPYDGPIKALMSPYEPPRFAVGGIVRGGQPVFLNEYCDYRIATGPRTTLVGPDRKPMSAKPGCQHPNPAPVILTTDEVVAAVCPDCLQPLPPSFVGSEWRP